MTARPGMLEASIKVRMLGSQCGIPVWLLHYFHAAFMVSTCPFWVIILLRLFIISLCNTFCDTYVTARPAVNINNDIISHYLDNIEEILLIRISLTVCCLGNRFIIQCSYISPWGGVVVILHIGVRLHPASMCKTTALPLDPSKRRGSVTFSRFLVLH